MKFFPLTVRVNAAPPAFATVGDIDAILGTGLFTGNVTWFDMGLPRAGFCTVKGDIFYGPAHRADQSGVVTKPPDPRRQESSPRLINKPNSMSGFLRFLNIIPKIRY